MSKAVITITHQTGPIVATIDLPDLGGLERVTKDTHTHTHTCTQVLQMVQCLTFSLFALGYDIGTFYSLYRLILDRGKDQLHLLHGFVIHWDESLVNLLTVPHVLHAYSVLIHTRSCNITQKLSAKLGTSGYWTMHTFTRRMNKLILPEEYDPLRKDTFLLQCGGED